MTAVNRLATGYEPTFDIDAEVGRQGELFIASVVDAARSASIEVKTDERAAITGNFYVEFECRGKPSGIAVTSCELWAFVLGDSAWVVPVSTLKELARLRLRQGHVKECERGSHPTRGVIVPIAWMVRQMSARTAA